MILGPRQDEKAAYACANVNNSPSNDPRIYKYRSVNIWHSDVPHTVECNLAEQSSFKQRPELLGT